MLLLLPLLTLPLYIVIAVQDISECPKLSANVNRDGSKIRPSDVKAIMAIGDDLLAALAAKTSLDDVHSIDNSVVMEYRGISFATGADPLALSLNSLFKHYNGDMVDGSRGAHPVPLCPGGVLCKHHDSHSYTAPLQDRLNVAISGATSRSLGVQFRELRRRAAKLHVAASEWKLLVVYIGAVDLCHFGCQSNLAPEMEGSGEHFEVRIRSLMGNIAKHLPKTIVTFILLPDLSQLPRFIKKHHKKCGTKDKKRIAMAQCPCAITNDIQSRWSLAAAVQDYNSRLLKIASDYNRKYDEQVVVHVSATLRDTLPHKHIPVNFVSPLDCLHMTMAAHKSLAARVWRGLFQRLSDQPQHLTLDEDVYCPNEADHIVLHVEEEPAALEL